MQATDTVQCCNLASLWLQDIAIVEPRPGNLSEDADSRTAADSEPQHCVLLRAGGQMSVLDMAQGLHLHKIRAILCACYERTSIICIVSALPMPC